MPITINGSGTVTGLSAGGLPAGSVTGATLASGVGGKILQVKNVQKDDAASSSSGTWVNIPDLTVDATATTSGNKFWIMSDIFGSTNNQAKARLAMDGTAISTGTTNGNREGVGKVFDRSNNTVYGFQTTVLVAWVTINDTNSHTFTVQWRKESGGGDIYINRSVNDGNDDSGMVASSMITLMEVAA